ncbi:MAG TPA: OmpA family protein [Polyangiales bacterium]|nr:OmpA family protein [Polyangiales bacterium]
MSVQPSESQRKTVSPRWLGARLTGALLCASLTGALAPNHAHGSPGVALDQLRARAVTEDGFSSSRPWTPVHLGVQTQLVLDYARNPLAYEVHSGSSGARVALVSDQLRAHLGASLGLLDFMLVYAQLPIDLVDKGTSLNAQPSATGFGAGDIALGGRLVFFQQPMGALALQLDTTFPLAKGSSFGPAVAGDAGVTFAPVLLGEVSLPFMRITTNLGVRFRKAVTLPGVVIDDELLYSLAIGVPIVKDVLMVSAEGFGVTPAADVGTRAGSPFEALLGVKLQTGSHWTFGAAGGPGFTGGYGAPSFRVLALAGYRFAAPNTSEPEPVNEPPPVAEPEPEPEPVVAPPPPPTAAVTTTRDTDNDGVPDAEDQCPALFGAADLGGCPETFQMSAQTGLLAWQSPLSWRARHATLAPQSKPVLEELARALEKNPALSMVVELHTGTKGDAGSNLRMSIDRAKNLVQWLTTHGAKREQIEAYGCGGNRPTGSGDDNQNERTEVYVVKPLPSNGMPSTLGCQAVTLPEPPPPPPAPPKPAEALREFGSLRTLERRVQEV